VDLSDERVPRRRPLFFPVVIATVFLSIIGMSIGLVLGSRHKSAVAGQQQPNNPAPAPTGRLCPNQSQLMGAKFGAVGSLRVKLEVKTASSRIWICSDDNGRLFYHANRGGLDAKWVENQTALFLEHVIELNGGYQASASDGAVFDVSEQELKILHKDGTPEVQSAEEVTSD
jgi:hypothetical protein